jgi:ParB family chromosome partitioning protein
VPRPRGLGRGLGALFPGAAGAGTQIPSQIGPAKTHDGRELPGAGAEPSIVWLDLDAVRPNPQQPRRSFDEESLRELAASIAEHGVLAPILVRPDGDAQGRYQIVSGERRWRAARMAGLSSIPAIVRPAQAAEAVELALVENVQRADLNPVEEAAGYRQLIEEYGYTQDMLAQRVGKSRPAIANALRLLSLPDDVLALVRDGKLSAGHARALASASPERARHLAAQAVHYGWSVRDVERAVAHPAPRSGRRGAAGRRQGPLPPDLADAESRLRFALATRVTIHPRAKGGTIEVQYADDDDLTRILDRIAPPGSPP